MPNSVPNSVYLPLQWQNSVVSLSLERDSGGPRTEFGRLAYGMFHHPGWALGSNCSSSPGGKFLHV